MCNRVATPREDEIKGYFDKMDTNLSDLFKVEPYKQYYHANAFTMPMLPFVSNDDPLKIGTAMWKYIPERASLEAYKKYDTYNAKGEEMFEKRTFKENVVRKRGLIVLKGFYEGQEQPDKTSQPFFIYPANGEIMTLGCIYSDWYNQAEDKVVRTFAIITTEANELMADIHNKKKRMPLVVPSERREWWQSDLSAEEIKEYIKPYPDGYLKAHKVSRNLYKPKIDTNLPESQLPIVEAGSLF